MICVGEIYVVFVIFHAVFVNSRAIFGYSSAYVIVIVAAALFYRTNHRFGLYKISDIRIVDALETIRVDNRHLSIAFGNFLLNNRVRDYAPELPLSPAVGGIAHYPAFAVDILDRTPIYAIAYKPTGFIFVTEFANHDFQRINVCMLGVDINISARILVKID